MVLPVLLRFSPLHLLAFAFLLFRSIFTKKVGVRTAGRQCRVSLCTRTGKHLRVTICTRTCVSVCVYMWTRVYVYVAPCLVSEWCSLADPAIGVRDAFVILHGFELPGAQTSSSPSSFSSASLLSSFRHSLLTRTLFFLEPEI